MLRRAAVISLCSALMVVAAACGSSSSGGGAQNGDRPSVSIAAPATDFSYAIWVAQAEGFFTKEGVNVKLIPFSSTGTDLLAFVESGSADFVLMTSLVPTLAVEKGATIKYLLMPERGDSQQISIRKGAANAQKIESAGSPTAQMQALKGSHYTIGVSTTASSSYSYLLSAAKLLGLTTGSGGDINIKTLGTPQNEIVAINAGKVDGVAGVPPTTAQPNTFSIQMDKVSPFSQMAGSYLLASDKFISSNPKAVQDVVAALVDAVEFIAKHSAQAEKEVVKAIQAADPTTTTAAAQADFATGLPHFQNPFPTKAAYEALSKMTNGQPPAGPFPAYTTAVDPQFATAAFKKAGIQVPTG